MYVKMQTTPLMPLKSVLMIQPRAHCAGMTSVDFKVTGYVKYFCSRIL